MLCSLTIRDVVLIDRLDLEFRNGLCVLTGETGAGKSILLDALGLALGERAEARLVRPGASQASVGAEFTVGESHPAHAILGEQGIAIEGGTLILRRVLNADGRSRAFVNDQPVSVGMLRSVGEACVEIHGQFESQRLLDVATHRVLLDAHGGYSAALHETDAACTTWRAADAARRAAMAEMETARRDEEFLRHAVEELASLDPQPGEEAELAEQRTFLQNAEKLIAAMGQASAELEEGRGVEGALRAAMRHLESVAPLVEGRLDAAIAALERAAVEAAEGLALLEKTAGDLDLDSGRLETVEERLFDLRAVARKHAVTVDELAELRVRLKAQLDSIEDGGTRLGRLDREAAAARKAFEGAAIALSAARTAAAARLDDAVSAELAPLRLGKAAFVTRIDRLPEHAWGAQGCDAVAFEVATNPGMPSGPLQRISSGGELSRFMLALKVVLAEADPVPTMVFDEVDANVGGAVADAVGERLGRLAGRFQILVVTHSPQVAARGEWHWRVSKEDGRTRVEPLSLADRREEIARMLAGAEITDAARAAAGSLLEGRAP